MPLTITLLATFLALVLGAYIHLRNKHELLEIELSSLRRLSQRREPLVSVLQQEISQLKSSLHTSENRVEFLERKYGEG